MHTLAWSLKKIMMLHRLSGVLSLAKLCHQAVSRLSDHFKIIISEADPTDGLCGHASCSLVCNGQCTLLLSNRT